MDLTSIPSDPSARPNTDFPVTVESPDDFDTASPLTIDGPSIVDLTGDGSVSLSPDALMAYCQARLDSIGSQVQSILKEQELSNGETSALQQVIATFQTYSAGVNSGDSQGASKCATMEAALGGLIDQIKASDPAFADLGKLEQTYNDLLYSGTGPQAATATTPALQYQDESTYPPNANGARGDNILSTDEVQGFVQSLQGVASDINSGAQLQMIQLESLMSQQQTAVELTTNLVQSLGDQSEKVAENIGH
jgi:hypothetical protein